MSYTFTSEDNFSASAIAEFFTVNDSGEDMYKIKIEAEHEEGTILIELIYNKTLGEVVPTVGVLFDLKGDFTDVDVIADADIAYDVIINCSECSSSSIENSASVDFANSSTVSIDEDNKSLSVSFDFTATEDQGEVVSASKNPFTFIGDFEFTGGDVDFRPTVFRKVN